MPRYASLLPLLVLIAACGQASAVTPEQNERPLPPVYVTEARTETVQERIRTVGQLEPDEAVQVASEVKGLVAEVNIEDGQAVEEGQILFRLEDTRAKAELQEAEARIAEIEAGLVKAKDDLDQDRALKERGIIDDKQLRATESTHDGLRASLGAAQARVIQLREGLADTVIRAPISGVVGERLVYRGDFVDEGDALVEVLRIDPLELRFSVGEKSLAGVAAGQRVDFLAPGFDDVIFNGTVNYIAPQADMISRNVAVKAIVPNAETRLRPGMFVKLQVITSERADAVVVPESAVVFAGSQTVVNVLSEGSTLDARNVELGQRTDNDEYEVLTGISAGEVVVIRGQHGLPPGAPVRVVE